MIVALLGWPISSKSRDYWRIQVGKQTQAHRKCQRLGGQWSVKDKGVEQEGTDDAGANMSYWSQSGTRNLPSNSFAEMELPLLVDRGQPPVPIWLFALCDRKEFILQRLGDGAPCASADRQTIHASNGRYLHGCAGEK